MNLINKLHLSVNITIMKDNYSDEEIEDKFEEEYLDDDYDDTKNANAKVNNDFWEAPKKQQ